MMNITIGFEYEAKQLGMQLRLMRHTKHRTLRETAESTGLSISYLSDLERGRRLPSIAALKRICAYYGVAAEVTPARVDFILAK